MNGDVSCDACGPVVIAAFDNATMTGAPLTDTTRDGPGPFALTFPADFGDVWMFAFADDNNNHAPDPDEIQISAGPYGIGQTALDIGTLELTNDPTPTDAAIDITGNLSCFEGCHPPFLLVFLEPTNDDVLASAVVESEGDYTVRIPHELGEVDVFAIEDLNQNQRYEPGEFFGAREATLAIGREGIDGVDLEIVYDESDWEIGGVRDALGTPTAPDELIVTLETDANAADIAAA